MNDNDNDNKMDGMLYSVNTNDDGSVSYSSIVNLTSSEEFSGTVKLSDEAAAILWAQCEGLEIIPR